ncbi:hypothetical protein [Antarcticirhabdus aurantiaca]|uniref:Uncharacterized protein n=1 Tax=Antarcticirhabdus aurantiaca TaxID=2606717 RepID=A0ACD4NV61_9HYPH|nr:hypothetical protein [Antarcticirhabdus aurantiaca]WAJ30477.1 hypothetical protein OXU80_09855 [Jeongeuplla avenae]
MALLDKIIRTRRYYRMARRPPTARGLLAMALTSVAARLIRKVVYKKR